jgi:hypothetical protein
MKYFLILLLIPLYSNGQQVITYKDDTLTYNIDSFNKALYKCQAEKDAKRAIKEAHSSFLLNRKKRPVNATNPMLKYYFPTSIYNKDSTLRLWRGVNRSSIWVENCK